mgnify:CR=1 FL=1
MAMALHERVITPVWLREVVELVRAVYDGLREIDYTYRRIPGQDWQVIEQRLQALDTMLDGQTALITAQLLQRRKHGRGKKR